MQALLRFPKKYLVTILLIFTTLTNLAAATPGCAGTGTSQVICGAQEPISLWEMIEAETSGGSWWMTAYGSGGAFDPETGIFTPDQSTQGIFMFTYYFTDDADCGNDSATVTLTFTNGDASDENAGHSCQGDSAMFDLNSEIAFTIAGQQGGGVWIRTEGTGGIFDAAAGTFECTPDATSSAFLYSTNGSCGTFSCTFNVYRAQRPVPGAGEDGEITVCEGTSDVINLHDIITGEEIYNPLWTRISGTGGELDPLTGIFTMTPETTTSVFRYRMASGAGMCGNDSSFVTLNVGPCENIEQACASTYWAANASAWCADYSPSTPLSSIFDVPQPLKSKSLLQALNMKGNGHNNLAKQAVTALLNICSDEISYPMPYGNSTSALIAAVNDAFTGNGNTVNTFGASLAALNQSDCPMDSGKPGNAIVVSPNPFSDRINVAFSSQYTGAVTMEIYDILGRHMSTGSADMSQGGSLHHEFSTGFTPIKGQLYFIRITTAQGTTVIKSVGE